MNSIESGEDREPGLQPKTRLLDEHRARVDHEERNKAMKADQGDSERAEKVTDTDDEKLAPVTRPRKGRADVEKVQDEAPPHPDLEQRSESAWPESFDSPASLAKRYLVAYDKYYFRSDAKQVAFEDKGKRLTTESDDPTVAASMVELAAAKDWKSIKVKGTADFKREVWLAASLRGMEINGFTPSSQDLARLDELRQRQVEPTKNEIIQDLPRERSTHSTRQVRPDHQRNQHEREDRQGLTAKQHVAVQALKEMLRARGDSDEAVNLAAKVASEKFINDRVYVGKIIETGSAPYQHDALNDMSHYVKLRGPAGERTVWGLDLERALHQSQARKGDEIALTYQGMKMVQIMESVRDKDGNANGERIEKAVERNAWDISKLDKLQEIARERVIHAAQLSTQHQGKQPRINVYDAAAPRRQEPESIPAKQQGRGKPKEPAVPR